MHAGLRVLVHVHQEKVPQPATPVQGSKPRHCNPLSKTGMTYKNHQHILTSTRDTTSNDVLKATYTHADQDGHIENVSFDMPPNHAIDHSILGA